MASSSTYPQTVQEMFDRLVADRPFRIRMAVLDNYTAVRDNFLAQLQGGYPEQVNTPSNLIDKLVWWDGNDPAGVDQVIDVPYRGTTGSAILTEAVEMGREMVEQSAGPKFFGAIVAGIGGIMSGVGTILNGRVTAESQARVELERIAAQAALDRQKAERNAQLIRMGIVAGTIIILIVAIIILRK